ncbi:hypothetical protein PI125_g14822 [Phytophthora idaei]|nr:hypothetical protein PI125_g14822 [Phytophthora idaei]KAG3145059.1 hypothetical protein PI126_g13891 [Phytophthora idaei]
MDVRGNRIVDDTVDTRCAVPDEREETRWPSSLHSNSLSFRKETRASDAEQRNESDYNIVDLTADQSDGDSTIRTESNTADADCEPSFSFNDPFLQHLLSKFIQDLPIQLKPVMNCTKKPRKMSWYIKYARKIERICQPHVHVQMGNTRVTIMVENRVWLKLKGSPTVDLLKKMIKSMRDEAISWREFKSEVEKCLEIYRNRLGDDMDLADVFLRAWNNIKDRTIEFSLPRGTHYFCGARFHHWSFNVGKIEIGSGSHEDKREAFRLVAASAAGFLLGLDDGRNEHSESVARAATATNLIDSPDSATGDVSGTDLAIPQSDHVKNEIKPSCQFDESAISVISSDSEDTLDNDSAMMVASSLVPAAPAIDTPSNEHVKVATRQVLPSSTSRTEATSAETETETEADSRPAKS